jgi:hypothetical protein
VLGFTAPGVAIQIQVAFRPAKQPSGDTGPCGLPERSLRGRVLVRRRDVGVGCHRADLAAGYLKASARRGRRAVVALRIGRQASPVVEGFLLLRPALDDAIRIVERLEAVNDRID